VLLLAQIPYIQILPKRDVKLVTEIVALVTVQPTKNVLLVVP